MNKLNLVFALLLSLPLQSALAETAILAGGCFWCVESDLEKVKGVSKVISGYSGGHLKNPTYSKLNAGGTGHREVVEVYFDPKVISYEKLLIAFIKTINPTDQGGQFVDRGFQYSPAIYYTTEEQKKTAAQVIKKLTNAKIYGSKEIATPLIKSSTFYQAEDYHQNYYKTHSLKYNYYRYASGRDKYLKTIWTKVNLKKLKSL